MTQALIVSVSWFLLWLLLSGYLAEPLLLAFGVLSCLLVFLIAWRIDTINPRDPSLRSQVNGATVLYWPWLLVEIVKANIDVTRLILDRHLPISPTLIRLKPTQRTELGRVIYANCITLTPGTVTTYLDDETLEVHALTHEGAEALRAGDMGRRIERIEGRA